MTVRQAAAELGVALSTVYALCRAGRLAHVRVGLGRGTIRIGPEDLAAYVASVRVEPTGPIGPAPARRPVPSDWRRQFEAMYRPKPKRRA